MKISRKINAFTLSEMLVVLVISSIVISLAFLSLDLVQKQVKNIQENLKVREDMQFVERILWKDFNENSKLKYNKSEGVLRLKNKLDSLSYIFNNQFLIRKNDTLPIEVLDKKLFLDGEEIKEGNFDAILIETPPVFGNKKLFIYKTKDASFYINK